MAKGKYREWITEDGLLRLKAWARNGDTDPILAKKIGINVATLYEWKNLYPEINNALKINKEVVDIEVENALLKRALGYSYDETTDERNSEGELVTTKVIHKQVYPDVTAQKFWLVNRKPAEWREKQDIALDASVAFKRLEDFMGDK